MCHARCICSHSARLGVCCRDGLLVSAGIDLDKANVPFWGFLAILVAVELYHKDKSEEATAY